MADETETVEETEVEQTTVETETTETSGAEPDWKVESRKHERRAKAEKKRADDLAAKQQELDDATKSEHEKAIEAARAEARAEAMTEAQQERRKDRLEVAVTRLSAKTFADTEDALVHVERAIAAGDIDPDEIFNDEGKVQTDALTTALDQLLERKPHLKASPSQLVGDGDGGKGSGPKDLENLGVEGHLKHVQNRK